MTSKSRAGRRGWELDSVTESAERVVDAELEAEVSAVASFFEGLPPEMRAYLDREARVGREGYPWP
jgi:hypothetical protein